jgi:hypothetical protein
MFGAAVKPIVPGPWPDCGEIVIHDAFAAAVQRHAACVRTSAVVRPPDAATESVESATS